MRSPSLHIILNAFRLTPWETFAVLAAIPALVIGGALLIYPNVYTLSKSYTVLAEWWPNAKILGAVVVSAVLLMLASLHHSLGRVGLIGVMLFHLLLCISGFAAVRFSGMTILYGLFLCLATYSFLQSGGVGHRRP